MIVNYGEIAVGDRCHLEAGSICLGESGVTVVRGENGTGKTLLIKRIYDDCRIRGTHVGLIDQSNSMILRRESVLANIAMSTDECELGVISRKVEELGYGALLEKRASTLSGGERRMVCLLRELVCHGDLLIVDEPTNDLSDEWSRRILSIIKVCSREMPILVVSHDPRVAEIARNEVVINNGHVDQRALSNVFDEKENKGDNTLTKKYDNSFLQRAFSVAWMVIAFLLAQILILVIYVCCLEEQPKELQDYPSDQAELFLPISESGQAYDKGAMPTKLHAFLRGEGSIQKMLTEWKNVENKDRHRGVVFCLEDILEYAPERVLIQEMYIPSQKEYLNKATLGLEETDVNVFLRELVGQEGVYITHLTILLEGEEAFLSELLVKAGIADAKAYVFSKKSCEMMDIMRLFQSTRMLLLIEMILGMVICLSLWLHYKLNRRESKTVQLFYQYGYEEGKILSAVTSKRHAFILYIGMLLVNAVFILCSTTSRDVQEKHCWIGYGLVAIYTAGILLIVQMTRRKFARRGMQWRWR